MQIVIKLATAAVVLASATTTPAFAAASANTYAYLGNASGRTICPPANWIPILMGRTPDMVFIDGCNRVF